MRSTRIRVKVWLWVRSATLICSNDGTNGRFINNSSKSNQKKWNKSVRLIMFIYSFLKQLICLCLLVFFLIRFFISFSFLGGVYLLFHLSSSLSLFSSFIFTSGYVCELNSISLFYDSLLLPLWSLFVSFASFFFPQTGVRDPMCKRKQRQTHLDWLPSLAHDQHHWRRSIRFLSARRTEPMQATYENTSYWHGIFVYFLSFFVYFCLSQGRVDTGCLINWRTVRVLEKHTSGRWSSRRTNTVFTADGKATFVKGRVASPISVTTKLLSLSCLPPATVLFLMVNERQRKIATLILVGPVSSARIPGVDLYKRARTICFAIESWALC